MVFVCRDIDSLLQSFFLSYMSLPYLIIIAFNYNNTEKVSPFKAQCTCIIDCIVLTSMLLVLANGSLNVFQSSTWNTHHTILRTVCHFLPPLTIASLLLVFSLPVVNLEWIGFLVVCVIVGIEDLYIYDAHKKYILSDSMIKTRTTDYTVRHAATPIVLSLLVPINLVDYKFVKWSIISVTILITLAYNFNVYLRSRKVKPA